MKRILVVDDNMMMRKLIINLFNDSDICFDEAIDGRDGLEKMHDNQYDLVITDILMPGMEGIEMIRHARKQFPELRIIAISGGEPVYLSAAKKLGIQETFSKPLERDMFLNAVHKNLNMCNAKVKPLT